MRCTTSESAYKWPPGAPYDGGTAATWNIPGYGSLEGMAMSDLKDIYHDLIRYESELWNAIDARLRNECGFPLTWLEILRMLERTGARRVQDMARDSPLPTPSNSAHPSSWKAPVLKHGRPATPPPFAPPADLHARRDLTPAGRRYTTRSDISEGPTVTMNEDYALVGEALGLFFQRSRCGWPPRI